MDHARILRRDLPNKILVIVIDGGKPPLGFTENDADPRATAFDYVVPVKKIIDVFDTILDDQRALRAAELLELRTHLTGTKSEGERVAVITANLSGRDLDSVSRDIASVLEEMNLRRGFDWRIGRWRIGR